MGKPQIDVHLHMGWGADGLHGMLMQQYSRQPGMLAIIPTTRQLENRKAYLVRTAPRGWDIRNYAAFTAWASSRIITTLEQFFEVSSTTDPRMDDMIISESFAIDGDDGDEPASFGVVVTSRRVFGNTVSSVRDQDRELVCATDGTYKLHFGGWTVVDCGSEAVVWSRNDSVYRFIPWVYMFVRSESTAAYSRMFQTIRERAMTLLHLSGKLQIAK